MRILIKGGVWKNSEDEILKAAIMKYGLNNWSRIASLLARKSPKQCKSRWYEWLDPSVKKTEWTREEEEKLLHLAKLFPTQWRTIAPIVGRTAYQCLEHYEKLLDQAQGRDEMDENDPRRLKPGEIDPHPETKPARADPVDMDEDEKEMLSEARARLANTRGKKAKRKAREKQLEEARRLAALQKRRELKAAGISTARKWRPRRGVDYAEEIPFEAAPPIGFHETGPEETPKVALGLANITLQAVENRNRKEEEDRNRRDDERKLKRLKAENLPEVIEAINKLNDPQQLLKRSALNLPAPQLTDTELETIVKMGADAAALAAQSADSSTAGLVQSYGETPGATPLRTPKQQNTILVEAQDAIARNAAQTPLYGEENPSINETDFTGVMPRPKTGGITPNIYAEQARTGTPGASPAPTPAGGAIPGRTPHFAGTPGSIAGSAVGSRATAPGSLRDGLALNQADDNFENDMMPPKLKKLEAQRRLRDRLGGLPAPVNEVEISMPELEDNDPTADEPLEEDAADADRRRERLEQERLEADRAKQSRAVKQGLPRPAAPQTMLFPTTYGGDGVAGATAGGAPAGALLQQAESLLHEEMAAIIANDAFLFPVKGAKPPKKPADPPEDISVADLARAEELLAKEVAEFDTTAGGEVVNSVALEAAFEDGLGHLAYLPQAKRYVEWRMVGKSDRLEAAKHMFEMSEAQVQRQERRANKLEDKLQRILGGHASKAKQAIGGVASLAEERETLSTDVEVFQTLRAREEKAIDSRIGEAREAVEQEKSRNAKLQALYRDLRLEEKRLDERLQ